jgi:hypothetical protein
MDVIGPFTSEGCSVGGASLLSGSYIQVETSAADFSGGHCNWVYLSGQYYRYPYWYSPVGPGWSYEIGDGNYTMWHWNATIADTEHSACEAGGACANWVHPWTHYP